MFNRCATCQLKAHSCPGHVGHIELPVQVYHPTFMDQLLRLLRAKCVYCHHLKMSRVVVNKFVCKLRLIQHGLLLEMEELENIHIKPKSANKAGSRGEGPGGSVGATESEDGLEEDVDLLMRRRTAFVKKAVKRAAGSDRQWRYQKSEAVSQERRLVVKEFLSSISKERICANCSGLVMSQNLLFLS
jgi:DNA-directed RNA polymerase I subunit RPA1